MFLLSLFYIFVRWNHWAFVCNLITSTIQSHGMKHLVFIIVQMPKTVLFKLGSAARGIIQT
jgi:hypothetical protein